MSTPPFRLAAAALPRTPVLRAPFCCEHHEPAADVGPEPEATPHGRLRLHQLPPHFHCSIIGTCLTTTELRKLVARHAVVEGRASDQDVHSAAVGLSEQAGEASKALHKALDRRHAATLALFAKARDEASLERLWSEAQERGEIPGAYWALLTHRDTPEALRSKAFGDVHMLSHLVGASNRADIRRLVALERDNAGLVERLERQQARLQALVEERDALAEALRVERLAKVEPHAMAEQAGDDAEALRRQVALQTERREQAEHRAQEARVEADRAAQALAEMHVHEDALTRELAAAESALQQLTQDGTEGEPRLASQLAGRRVAYIGGRPSSTPAIRALVQRCGGRFAHHDGGLEDRKGLLSATISGADLVAFPMDCIDHDSVNTIKRLCARHGVAFLPLRTASATSLMSALGDPGNAGDDGPRGPICLRHG